MQQRLRRRQYRSNGSKHIHRIKMYDLIGSFIEIHIKHRANLETEQAPETIKPLWHSTLNMAVKRNEMQLRYNNNTTTTITDIAIVILLQTVIFGWILKTAAMKFAKNSFCPGIFKTENKKENNSNNHKYGNTVVQTVTNGTTKDNENTIFFYVLVCVYACWFVRKCVGKT